MALALAALGVALLVGTFAYLAYDRSKDVGESAGAPEAEGTPTAASEERPSGAETRADGHEAEGAGSRSVPAEAGGPPEAAAPPVEREKASPQPPAPEPSRADASVAPGAVPAYALLRESRADGVEEVVVETDATGEDGMRLVASDLASRYAGEGVLLVGFREGANGGASEGRETGFALVFGSREAAMAPDLEYTPKEVDEIFREDGGIRAVSYEDLGEENPSLRDDLARIGTA